MAAVTLPEAQAYLKFVSVLQDLPKPPFLLLYGSDVLYIDFYSPPKSASDSELTDDDVVIRYDDDDEVVGLTVLNASRGDRKAMT